MSDRSGFDRPPGARRLASRRSGLRVSGLVLAVAMAGCASTQPAPPRAAQPKPRSQSSRVTPAEAGHATPRADAEPSARPRVRYALAEHLERARMTDRSTLHVELGTPSGARHTGGGWLTNVGPDVRLDDGVDAALTVRRRARLALPANGRAAHLAVRLRSFRPGTARLYLDGAQVASTELDGAGWSIVTAELSAEQLAPGEHEVLVRFDRGRSVHGVPRAYLAVDWLRLGQDGEPGEARPTAAPVEGVPAMHIPARWALGYPFEVPVGARLRGVLRGDAGMLEVWAEREGEEPTRLAALAAGEEPRPVDVDLSGIGGSLARLELRASGGSQTLYRPAVVTLDAPDPADLPRPRHALVYLIDTLRADRLEVYDADTRVRAPGLARFARDAATFLGARSQECWTKPSVATLLSSLLPWEHTAFSDASRVPASVRLLPEMLGDRGFATAGFVANGYVSNRFGFRRGWDTWRNYIREGRRTRGEVLASDVLSWLDGRPQDRPFFLYVHAIDPHVPYRPPDRYVQLYDPAPYRGRVDFSRDPTLLEHIKTGELRLTPRDRTRLEALYDGEVSYQDAQLAAVLDGLQSRGLADETLVVITADHGEELFDHGSVGHGHSLYDELVRVPLLLRLPGVEPRRLDGAVGLVDVAPTILDALGEPIPEGLSGRSLLPMLRGEGQDAPASSVAGFMEHWRSVTVGRYKLIARSRGRYQLYDLAEDPREQNDLSASRPMALAYLRGLLGLRLSESRPEPAPSSRRPRRRHRPAEATIDEELEAQLRALGYVGTSRPR